MPGGGKQDLLDLSEEDEGLESLYGALQSAIIATGINGDLGSGGHEVIDDWAIESDYVWERLDGRVSRRGDYLRGNKADGAWGTMTQAHLLSQLGSALTVRSDTFKIRAYGSASNPATGAAEGKAWIEATVQRMPHYLIDGGGNSDGDDPFAIPEYDGDGGVENELNNLYGRKFKIISMRWLNEDEI